MHTLHRGNQTDKLVGAETAKPEHTGDKVHKLFQGRILFPANVSVVDKVENRAIGLIVASTEIENLCFFDVVLEFVGAIVIAKEEGIVFLQFFGKEVGVGVFFVGIGYDFSIELKLIFKLNNVVHIVAVDIVVIEDVVVTFRFGQTTDDIHHSCAEIAFAGIVMTIEEGFVDKPVFYVFTIKSIVANF